MAINEKRTHFSIWKTFLTMFFIAVLGFILLGVTVVKDAKDIEIGQSLTIEIPDGAGASVVSELLHENGAVKYPTVFRLCSRLGNFDGQYKPGPVTLHNGMSYLSILELLISERNIVKVVIPEGYTIRQIAETVAASGLCSADEFYAVLDASLYDYRFLKDIPERENRLEGYLFPATYEFFPGASAQEIVDAMLKRFDEVFTDEYYKRAEEVNVTVDEVITMASIVERETNADGERAKVAGVFYNRINENIILPQIAQIGTDG